jgi:hypothetical protein
MTAVIFPDIEAILVEYFSSALEARLEPYTDDVLVSVKRAQLDDSEPVKQVIITGAYGRELDVIRKEATITVDVYADSYEDSTDLANMVAALSKACTGKYIKFSEVSLGPVRNIEESVLELRSITLDLIVKGEVL